MANTFHKSERLCSKKQIDTLFKEGKSKTAFPIKLMMLQQPALDGEIKAMFVVPKKKFKHANDRNKLKRRMREAYRVQKKEYYTLFEDKKVNVSLAFIYIGNTAEVYDTIYKSIQKLLTLK